MIIASDLGPGFWCEYSEPRTAVLKLAQQPLHAIDGQALANAVMKDFRASKKRAVENSVEIGGKLS